MSMPSPAESRPEFSEQVALTAGALDQLDMRLTTLDLQHWQPDTVTDTSSKVAEYGGGGGQGPKADDIDPKDSHTNFDLLQKPDASMTDYIVDGLIYRSPDTLGTLIEVRRSPGKGYGVFALRHLPIGTLLLSERPLVKLNDDGSRADPLDGLVNALTPALKKAYRSLHGFQELQQPHMHAPRPPPRESLNRRVLYSNGFAIETTTTAVFALASRINHSCVPNARFQWDADKGRMDYVAVAKLLEGEEVTIDYGHSKGHLKKYYGFDYDCDGCLKGCSDALTDRNRIAAPRVSQVNSA